MAVELIPPQPTSPRTTPPPIPYTGSPLLLCLSDIRLFFRNAWSLPGILFPALKWPSGALDELYPSPRNLLNIFLQAFLILIQAVFLLTLPFLSILPVWTAVLYIAFVFSITLLTARVINGREDVLHSSVDVGPGHAGEAWVYLNGIATGKHWLQSNLDRLALTFRRPVVGVHNRTYGLLFDILQCIIERDFCYATADIRRSYATIKAALLDVKNTRVVLILHSQGGIEGGLILDWLLTELPHDIIHKVEIYTFGSAANHFNNPPRYADAQTERRNANAVRYIEHYASDGEFVARWGVLHFAPLPNRYAGRVFIRSGTGHLLNQHYLNDVFPLDEKMQVKEHNAFMDMDVIFTSEGAEDRARNGYVDTLLNNGVGVNGVVVEDGRDGIVPVEKRLDGPEKQEEIGNKWKVRDFSRLWLYRNGRSPED